MEINKVPKDKEDKNSKNSFKEMSSIFKALVLS